MAFSFRAGTNWCHDFPKLARESGFHFNMHRRRVRVDWNRISSIDVDRVVGERDFSTIDDNVNNVIDYCLESEYDVKILDPNFVKLFRLAQLAVEYLLYCKQYLDHSVVILKEELKSKLEENTRLKNDLSTSEKSVKELRDKLNRIKSVDAKLSDSHGEIHKCSQCPKTFVSASFLNAHVNRRHPNVSPLDRQGNSPGHERYRAETEKLHSEIKSLKERLNLTERVIRNESEKFLSSDSALSNDNRDTRNNDKDHQSRQNNRERDIFFEEQHRRYQEEFGHLKATLFDEIRSLKTSDRYANEKSDNDDCKNVTVKELIREQENEITRLREELAAKRASEASGEAETRRDAVWQSKISGLEARYRADVETLYDQLRMTQKSADEMRDDYTRRLSELERREATLESSFIRERDNDDRPRYRLPSDDDNDTSALPISEGRVFGTKNISVVETASRRLSGNAKRARIRTNGNSSESDSEHQHEAEKTSRFHEDRDKRNNAETEREKTFRDHLRNGEMKIRVGSNRREKPWNVPESGENSPTVQTAREKSWNFYEPRENSLNAQGSRRKTWNRCESREKSWTGNVGPREKSSNCVDPGERSWNWDESREKSPDVQDPREKSRQCREEPRAKSPSFHEPREKSRRHREEPKENSSNIPDPRGKPRRRWDEPKEQSPVHAPRERAGHRRDEPRERSPNVHDPREKGGHRRDDPREISPNFHDSREKIRQRRNQPREKSPNGLDPPAREKFSYSPTTGKKFLSRREEIPNESPNLRERRSEMKTRVTSQPEKRKTRLEVPRGPKVRTNIGKSARREITANESAKHRKSDAFTSSEEEIDSQLESESISGSSCSEEENEDNERSRADQRNERSRADQRNERSRADQRNDRFRVEEKSWDCEKKGSVENGLELINSKLRELGVDPEWRGIPYATFSQILEIVRHHRNINSKKYRNFEDTRRRLTHELSRKLAKREKEIKIEDTNSERSQLGRLVTNVKGKVSKALTIIEKNDGSYVARPVLFTTKKSVVRENDQSRKLVVDRSPLNKSRSKSSAAPREPKKSSNFREFSSSEDSHEVNDDSTRKRNFVRASSTNKQLSHSYESIKDFINNTNPRHARSIFNVSSAGIISSTPQKINDLPVGDSERKNGDSSTIRREVKERDLINQDNVDSPRNNGKSVLKPSGSIANLAKKKVLFDLETTRRNDQEPSMYPDEPTNHDPRDGSESDFDISSIRDEKDQAFKDESAQASKVVLLKTSQSEKIAQISQQIEKQLSVARRKPVGAVEAMFMEKCSLPSDNKDFPIDVHPSFEGSVNPIAIDQTHASSWQKDAPSKRDEIANLDMDIDELLRLE